MPGMRRARRRQGAFALGGTSHSCASRAVTRTRRKIRDRVSFELATFRNRPKAVEVRLEGEKKGDKRRANAEDVGRGVDASSTRLALAGAGLR